MTKTQAAKPKTPFASAPLPWAWNHTVPGGTPARDRCQASGTPKEREQAEALIAAYREQEAIASENDISGMSEALGKLTSVSRSAGGFEGEMMRRRIRAADPDKYNAAQDRLTVLRQEAMDLVTPVIRRVLVSYSESLAEAAVAAETRLEANGLPIRDHSKVTINSPNADTWVLHDDAVCRALWSCRVRIEKTLFGLQSDSAIGATQFFLTSEEHTPFNWS